MLSRGWGGLLRGMCGRHCSERGFTVCTRAERGRGRIDKSINVMVPPLRQQSNNLMHCRQTDRHTLAAARAQSQAVHRSRGREGFGGEGGGGSSNDRPSLPSFVLLFWRLIYMCISSTDTTEDMCSARHDDFSQVARNAQNCLAWVAKEGWRT